MAKKQVHGNALGLAPEDTRVKAAKPLEPVVFMLGQVARLVEDPRFEAALRAIIRRRKPGSQVAAQDAGVVLSVLAWLAVNDRAQTNAKRQKMWALNTCKTWRQIERFPERLAKMADEVKGLHRGPLFACWRDFVADYASARILLRRFEELPAIMEMYAKALELWIKKIPGLKIPGLIEKPARNFKYSDAVLRLSLGVKDLTGRVHDEEVIELLESAAQALGVQTFRIDITTLTQLRVRRKAGRAHSKQTLH